MASAEAEITPLARAVKFDMATQAEVVRLEALERYTVLLNRVDCTNPEDRDQHYHFS
ncbi:tail fiber assembly protein [Mangrovibacter sp. MFB070]|uniref:tail fiber assembly protein n=1 Tax=Mangrovibacter sp. MFB070 TaxID=1224318 RepID=UPI0009FFB28D|nr:tail fiber assembly protein [Mangrovibacter sp. MFB070]